MTASSTPPDVTADARKPFSHCKQEGPMFSGSYAPRVLCSQGPMLPGSYAPRVLCSQDPMSKSYKLEEEEEEEEGETQQSPFKVPDNNSIFQLSINERGDQKEEMRKFLALPIDEKTTHAARMMAKLKKELAERLEEEEEGEEEEKEKKKNVKQIKSRAVLPKQTPSRHELKMAMMKRENVMKDSKHDFISMERQKAVLELSLMTKRSEILRMDKAITKEEGQLKQLEKIIERDNLNFEAFLRENEKKSVEARTFFEREAKSKQEKNAEIKKLTAEIGTIKSEIAKFEEILIDYKRYKELLFKLSPPEWQEAQKTKALKAEVLSDGDKHNREPAESAVSDGLENKDSSPGRELPSIRETRLSSAHSDTLITNSKLDSDSSEYEDEPELYFTDPKQLLDLVTELTEQNLSLIQNSTRVEETLEELRQSMETTRKKIEKDEEQLTLQLNDMNQRIDKEKARSTKLKQKVQLHVSLNTEDQDVMLDALGEKVADVHRCCVDDRMTNLSTLEKLANIENRMSLLLQGLESIPEESLEMMKKIKDSERRSRQREEKLREQSEKQKERMRRYMERSLADSKKISGRKLMPRCMPVAQKVRVSNVDNTPAEDEIHAYLFTSEDIE
ncbi:cilia- and flagella-associated protein 100-like [Siniperca chuatsi]|uniref:cilia- and flagella-associated protein 100-like n=1 Tax=Siniperca chuatsi TaxID=119488 RepID=UPI001CE2023F|nr:cilia- and flagella-associated protein 100-like [Siniperca chuatsi]